MRKSVSDTPSVPNVNNVPRREFVRLLTVAATTTGCIADARADSAAPRTIINGVLSGYGLPNVRDEVGKTRVSEQYSDNIVVEFVIPSAWVVRRAHERGGLLRRGRVPAITAGDYRRSEGVALYVSDARRTQWANSEIAALVTPGDATVTTSVVDVVRTSVRPDGSTILETRFESTTRSGYVVSRRAITRAILRNDGSLFALAATCTAERWKKCKPGFDDALESFQVFRI